LKVLQRVETSGAVTSCRTSPKKLKEKKKNAPKTQNRWLAIAQVCRMRQKRVQKPHKEITSKT